MMKKGILLAAALLMTLVFAFSALAEEPEESYDWSDEILELIDGVDGSFLPLKEIGLQVWVPDAMTAAALTEEEAASGCLYRFILEDGSAELRVARKDTEAKSLEAYRDSLTVTDEDMKRIALINGIPALVYVLDEENTGVTAYCMEDGSIVEFFFMPALEGEFAELSEAAAISVMAIAGEQAA